MLKPNHCNMLIQPIGFRFESLTPSFAIKVAKNQGALGQKCLCEINTFKRVPL